VTWLREHNLLDSTIVLMTGDHGEEFMEKGHWGHARGYPDEQTRVPMVLWVPGRPAAQVQRMTSHLDLPATILPLLGVSNPPEDYSLGYDMLSDTARSYTVLCDWNNLCIVDAQYKATFPTSGYGWRGRSLTTKDDRPVANPAAFYEADKPRMVEIMKQMKLFSR
jgi:membrane-anchored protein YejM (alkaline phosphatase superfamily)